MRLRRGWTSSCSRRHCAWTARNRASHQRLRWRSSGRHGHGLRYGWCAAPSVTSSYRSCPIHQAARRSKLLTTGSSIFPSPAIAWFASHGLRCAPDVLPKIERIWKQESECSCSCERERGRKTGMSEREQESGEN